MRGEKSVTAGALVVVVLASSFCFPPSTPAEAGPVKAVEATVSSSSDDKLVVVPIGKAAAITVEVPKDLEETVKGLQKGDTIIVQLSQVDGKSTLKSLSRKVTREGTVAAKAGDSTPLTVVPDGETNKLILEVPEGHRGFVKDLQKGDKVTVQYLEEREKNTLTNVLPKTAEIGWIARAVALFVALCVYVIVLALFTSGDLLNTIIGYDNRYSNSQFQLAIWFGVLVAAYVSTIALRGWYSWTSGFGLEFLEKVTFLNICLKFPD